jgi:hypothetical protein
VGASASGLLAVLLGIVALGLMTRPSPGTRTGTSPRT